MTWQGNHTLTRKSSSIAFTHPSTNKDCYKFSFVPRTLVERNRLPLYIREAPSIDSFKTRLHVDKIQMSTFIRGAHHSFLSTRPHHICNLYIRWGVCCSIRQIQILDTQNICDESYFKSKLSWVVVHPAWWHNSQCVAHRCRVKHLLSRHWTNATVGQSGCYDTSRLTRHFQRTHLHVQTFKTKYRIMNYQKCYVFCFVLVFYPKTNLLQTWGWFHKELRLILTANQS